MCFDTEQAKSIEKLAADLACALGGKTNDLNRALLPNEEATKAGKSNQVNHGSQRSSR